jgi:hypothetical protein
MDGMKDKLRSGIYIRKSRQDKNKKSQRLKYQLLSPVKKYTKVAG